MAKLAGKGGRIKAGSANVKVTRWSGDLRADLVDASSTEGNGFEEFVVGLQGGDIEGDLVFDIAETPLTVLTPGSAVVISLMPDLTVVASVVTGTMLVANFRITNEVRGLVTGNFTGKFTLGYTATAL